VKAWKAYIASLGTTGVLITSFVLVLAVVSAIVAFRGWPGEGRNDGLEGLLVDEGIELVDFTGLAEFASGGGQYGGRPGGALALAGGAFGRFAVGELGPRASIRGALGGTGSATGLPIDPASGLPIDSATGLPIDPASGLPIDPSRGLPIPPGGGLPKVNLPYLSNPTGELPQLPETPRTPSAPGLPSTPELPSAPRVPPTPLTPQLPETPSAPQLPSTPQLPQAPSTPQLPSAPQLPQTPQLPPPPSAPQLGQAPQLPSTPQLLPPPPLPDGP
jgi:hypothetical protein